MFTPPMRYINSTEFLFSQKTGPYAVSYAFPTIFNAGYTNSYILAYLFSGFNQIFQFMMRSSYFSRQVSEYLQLQGLLPAQSEEAQGLPVHKDPSRLRLHESCQADS